MALERYLAKNVEMNYHTHLVLFQKNRDILTQLEVDEYLNPSILEMSNPLSPKNAHNRRLLRRNLVVQSAVLALVSLMVGLIHLAPIGATVPPVVIQREVQTGYLQVVINPWAEVIIDGVSHGYTPIAAPLSLSEGTHSVVLKNRYYESYKQEITLRAGPKQDAQLFRVDLDKLKLNVAPDQLPAKETGP